MINVYRYDKNVCCKHTAAEQGASISYRSRDIEAKKKSAATRQQQRKAALHQTERLSIASLIEFPSLSVMVSGNLQSESQRLTLL